VAVLLAGVVGILSVAGGHVWPWFLLWSAPLVALRWDCLPAKLLIAALVAAPVLNAHWILARTWTSAPDVGLAFYAVVAVLSIAAARFVFRPQRYEPAQPEIGMATNTRGAGT
jgi:hypothetical protein